MRKSTTAFTIALSTAFIARPAEAAQQPISEAEAIELDNVTVPEIPNLNQNLLGISKLLRPHESRAVLDIVVAVRESCDAVNGLAILASIHQEMLNVSDQSRVEYWLPNQLALAKHRLDVAIEYINSNLGHLTTPAALSEAQRIRDRLLALRLQLEQYSY